MSGTSPVPSISSQVLPMKEAVLFHFSVQKLETSIPEET